MQLFAGSLFEGFVVASRVIPNYALYGDQPAPNWTISFDFEWIPTRSRPYNWKSRPHKHDAFIQILYLTRGGGELAMDNHMGYGRALPDPDSSTNGARF